GEDLIEPLARLGDAHILRTDVESQRVQASDAGNVLVHHRRAWRWPPADPSPSDTGHRSPPPSVPHARKVLHIGKRFGERKLRVHTGPSRQTALSVSYRWTSFPPYCLNTPSTNSASALELASTASKMPSSS